MVGEEVTWRIEKDSWIGEVIIKVGCDRSKPLEEKDKFYKMVVRSGMLYTS